MFTFGPEYPAQRQRIIDSAPELQERELLKLAALTRAVAVVLRGRDVDEDTADLVALTGVDVFVAAFTRWVSPLRRDSPEPESRALPDIIAEVAGELHRVVDAPGRLGDVDEIEDLVGD